MTDEEILNKAKETSGGNYSYEQGFVYGFELGEENGRKEIFPSFVKKKEMLETRVSILEEENAELKEQIENMQSMEYSNMYEQRKNLHKNLIDEFTEQLGIMDKEEDVLFSFKAIKSIIDFIMELE